MNKDMTKMNRQIANKRNKEYWLEILKSFGLLKFFELIIIPLIILGIWKLPLMVGYLLFDTFDLGNVETLSPWFFGFISIVTLGLFILANLGIAILIAQNKMEKKYG